MGSAVLYLNSRSAELLFASHKQNGNWLRQSNGRTWDDGQQSSTDCCQGMHCREGAKERIGSTIAASSAGSSTCCDVGPAGVIARRSMGPTPRSIIGSIAGAVRESGPISFMR
jgi:hypothetical protein